MQHHTLLTIIVPVYNTANYLPRCLDCLSSQTYQDIEIIAVNDGSPDNSSTILHDYARKDKRIKVLEKKNGGVSSARNLGISKATGDFVTFLDSDDWVDKDYYNELMNYISPHVQLICGSFQINENGVIHKTTMTRTSLSIADSISVLYNTYYGMLYNVWGKIFRRDIIINNNIVFKHVIREDGIFLLDYMKYIDKASIISNSSYLHYNTDNANSITHKTQGIDRVMHGLFIYYNSFNKIIESDNEKYDLLTHIINIDKTKSYCDILHETYPLTYKEKIFWYNRMIEQLPNFILSKHLNKPIHKCLKIAFILRSGGLVYSIIKVRLVYMKVISVFQN